MTEEYPKQVDELSGDNDHLTEEEIATYCESILGKRTDLLPSAVLEHVEKCAVCKRKIANLVEFIQSEELTIGSLPRADQKPEPRSIGRYNTFSFVLSIAAVAVVLCAVTMFLYFLIKNPGKNIPVPEVSTNLSDTARRNPTIIPQPGKIGKDIKTANESKRIIQPDKAILAANFKSIPSLENYVSVNLRSQGIEVITPDNKAVYKEQMTFRWKPVDEQVSFSIRNNRNQTVFSKPVIGAEIIFRQPLEPGLYYWILENEKEILYVGKFTVQD